MSYRWFVKLTLALVTGVPLIAWVLGATGQISPDPVRDLQIEAVRTRKADWGHWGPLPDRYSAWKSHTNRLIPVYTYGGSLAEFSGEKSVYRNADRIRQLYGRVPYDTLNPKAEYFDQTDIYRLQKQAVAAGKKRVILFIFDGMDWQTTWAAATFKAGKVAYREGRGTGLAFQDYKGAPTDFGFFVTSPHNDGTTFDVDRQMVRTPGGKLGGGYDAELAGATPWAVPADPFYPIGQGAPPAFRKHAYTDSSSSATSMTAGIKTYNDGVNIDSLGRQVPTIAQQLQQQGFKVGAVTSVPISHATPACAYAHNVSRDDYQDLTRDLLGLKSVSHPSEPLAGLDVLIGGGWGEDTRFEAEPPPLIPVINPNPPVNLNLLDQGENFVPGNRYLCDADLAQIDVTRGGKYRVVQRTPGVAGGTGLSNAAKLAAQNKERLFGFFGVHKGHLPFRTADGRFDPTTSPAAGVARIGAGEHYTAADIHENPTLADMSRAALQVLSTHDRFWLMIEAGDVDWANHANNIDDSIGAVLSGDDAFRAVTDWIEAHDAWKDTLVIVTADHGHYLVLDKPEVLAGE